MDPDYEQLLSQAGNRLFSGKRVEEPVARKLLNKLIEVIDLYEFSPVVYMTLNRHAMILNCNYTSADALGCPRGELMGRRFYEFVHPDERDGLFLFLRGLLKSPGRHTCELPLHSNAETGARWRYVRLDAFHDRDDHGYDLFRVTMSDISEQMDLRDKVEQQRSLFQTIIERMPTGLYVIEAASGQILLRNQAAESLLEDGLEKAILHHGGLHPDGSAFEEDAYPLYRALFLGQTVSQEQLCFRGPNGRVRHLSISAAPLRDHRGRIISAVLVFNDRTDLRETEAQLRRRSEELQLATHAGGVGIWDADLTRGDVRWNEVLYELLGLSPRPGPEPPDAFFGYIHPDDRREQLAGSDTVARSDTLNKEFRVIRADGQIRWLAGKGTVYRDAKGRPVRMIGVNFDITERKETEAALARSRSQLEAQLAEVERINAELNEYAYVVSHDLKAPLRAIHNYATFLTQDLADRLDEQCAAHLAGVRAAVARGDALIADLLVFSQIGASPVAHETVNLSAIVEEVKVLLHPPEPTVIRAADSLPVLFSDSRLLQRILLNLIGNGLKFNTAPQKRIEVGCQPAWPGSVEIFVRDNGIGIDPRYHVQIFRVFQRLHGEKAYPGTGIGLAIVKKAAQYLGGDVRVESQAGKGSTFFVRLPARETVEG